MTPKLVDYGHHEADKELMALIRRLHLSYRQARIGLQEKIEKYLDEFEQQDAMMRALYDSGELSHEDFLKWRQKKIMDTRAWRDMNDQLAYDMMHQNQIAASMIYDTLPGVYALNHNYGTYEAEVGSGYDTTYTMYDKFTVRRLLKENDNLLPHPSVPIEKDLLWNRQHLQSALLQGILTGEPVKDIAKRFMYVSDMTENSAMRNARTAVTGAENAGRIDSYIRAEKMGIKMRQMWLATLDSRTRDSHAIMDGEQQEVGEKFSNGCRYPGDPEGDPGEVYNCRCTLVAVVEGADPYNPNLRKSDYLEQQGLTYEEWKQMHGDRYYTKLFKDKNTSLIDLLEKEHATPMGYEKASSYLKTLGYSDEDATLMSRVISAYIRNPNAVLDNYTDKIDDMIEKMPKWDGRVYRGIVTRNDFEVGDKIDENKISSWTSRLTVAREYSGSAEFMSDNAWDLGRGDKSVIFVCDDVGGVSISRFHDPSYLMRRNGQYVEEVITPSYNEYEVTKIEEKIESGYRKVEYVYLKKRRKS